MGKFKLREREPRKKNSKRSLGGKCQLKGTKAAADTSEKEHLPKIELSPSASEDVVREFACQKRAAIRDALYSQGLTGIIKKRE